MRVAEARVDFPIPVIRKDFAQVQFMWGSEGLGIRVQEQSSSRVMLELQLTKVQAAEAMANHYLNDVECEYIAAGDQFADSPANAWGLFKGTRDEAEALPVPEGYSVAIDQWSAGNHFKQEWRLRYIKEPA